MNREVHVRICEGEGVRFPRATRLLWPSQCWWCCRLFCFCWIIALWIAFNSDYQVARVNHGKGRSHWGNLFSVSIPFLIFICFGILFYDTYPACFPPAIFAMGLSTYLKFIVPVYFLAMNAYGLNEGIHDDGNQRKNGISFRGVQDSLTWGHRRHLCPAQSCFPWPGAIILQ